MKFRALCSLVALGAVACTPTYKLAQPNDSFVSDWNSSVADEALELITDKAGGYRSKDGHLRISYSKNGYRKGDSPTWVLMAYAAEIDPACAELLMRTAAMPHDRALSLVNQADRNRALKVGNLEFSMAQIGTAVALCTVNLTKKNSGRS